nr:integrase, catalytic region, zinc finger, CCHC-type, peptidase aspartic, catalytic [Tanacetum cinerariifolium]
MTESPLVDSGFAVPVFSREDDPIAFLNKVMAFLIAIASSRQAMVVKCYKCQGEGHMARQCTQPKRPRNAAWYKDKTMFIEAQEAGQILDEEQLAFLADLGIPVGQDVQTIIPNIAAFQTEDLDTYDSDCDDISNAKVVLIANISNYGFDVISEERFTSQQELSAEQAFWLGMFDPTSKPSDALPVKIEAPKELLKIILEQADILRGIVKQAKAKQPLDNALDFVKSKKSSHQPKAEDTNQEKLYLLHIDLCGLMRVASINGKSDDLGKLDAKDDIGIFIGYVPAKKAFRIYNKTPYELMQDKKPYLSFFYVFGTLCYPTNDSDDLGKLDAKDDICIFIGYVPAKKAFRIYNKRTRKIIKTILVTFDELTAMASGQLDIGPGL